MADHPSSSTEDLSSNPKRSTHMISSENCKKSEDVETKDDSKYKKPADYVSGRDPNDCAIENRLGIEKNSGEQTNPETEDVMKKISAHSLRTPTMICCNHCVHVPGRDFGRYPNHGALACKLCGWALDNYILSSEVTYVENPARKKERSSRRIVSQELSGSAGGIHQYNDPTMDVSGRPMMVWCDRCIYVPADSNAGALACKLCGWVFDNYILSPEVTYVENATARKKEKSALDTDLTTSETNDVDKLDNAARKMMQSQTLLINQSQCGGSDHRIMAMNQQQQVVNMAQSKSSKSGGSALHQRSDPTVDNYSSSVSAQSLPGDILVEIFDRVPPSTKCYQFCRAWRRYYRFRQRSWTIVNPPVSFFPLSGRYFYSLVSLTLDFSLADFPEPNQTTSTAGGEVVQLVTDHDLATVAEDFPRLQRLELLGCDLITAPGLTHLVQECQRLSYLHLRDCRHFDDDAVLVVVRASASLEHIEIAFCEVTAAGIATLRTLTKVSARGCPRSEALRRFPHPI